MPTEMTPSEARRWLESFNATEVLTRTSDRIRPGMVAAMRAAAPYDSREHSTGDRSGRHLRDSIIATRDTDIGRSALTFTSDVPQAKFVMEGTRAHPIHPKGDNHPLTFFWKRVNQVVSSFGWHGSTYGYVEHPGTKKNLFSLKAWEATRAGVVEAMRATVEEQLLKGRDL